MGLFDKTIRFIDGLERQMFLELQNTLQRYDFVIVDFITNKQLFREGIDGKKIKLKGYTRTTIRIKAAKGDPYDRTTLRDTGDFYKSIFVDAGPDGFTISTDDPKAKLLVGKYGPDILRPTQENFAEFMQNYFLPNFIAKQRAKLI